MNKYFKKIKTYLRSNFIKASFIYPKYYQKNKLKEKILIQSYDGSSISGNPYYLLLELCKNEEYKNIKKVVIANQRNEKHIKQVIKDEELSNTEVVVIHSRKYCKELSEAKYLINNSTFPTYFIKKEGQIYLNTWHGTPLKAMGRDIIDSPHELGNTQRNFIMSDYLLYQNDFMYEKMQQAYMLDNLYNGKYIISGYPRNDIFYDNEDRINLKKQLNIENKKITIYMPTWRGTATHKKDKEQANIIKEMLDRLEDELDDNSLVYLKIHNLANTRINYEKYTKIKPFPNDIETYRFLNIADCLVTDYSSVMFDFANTGKKIILYTYDYEEYTTNRGFYLNVKDLPFNLVYDVNELCNEIKKIDKNINYEEFTSKYCSYDSIETSKKICELVFKNNKNNLKVIEGKDIKNNKENILIFTGALLKNGITSALKGLINNIDLEKYNYYLTFYRNAVKRNKHVINAFPKGINYIPIQGRKDYKVTELLASFLYFRFNIQNIWIKNKLRKIYEREIARIYPNINFKNVIDFCGYDKQPMNMFNHMNATKIRFTHSNMEQEQKTRSNIHIPSLKNAYINYDKIAIVREGMDNEIKNHFKNIQPKCIQLVHNVNDVKNIEKQAEMEIEFLENTYSNYEKEDIEKILNDDTKIKFINIGRFSKEKGQERLVQAFKDVSKENKDIYLIIIGGHGKEFNSIRNLIAEENLENVIIIRNMENPFPILKKCDLFILSSYYEGLPMTIMESLILEVPILSVNIEGPRKFLEQGYAYLVEDSENGLREGMKKFIANEYKELKKFDSKEFNQNAINEFYKLLEN